MNKTIYTDIEKNAIRFSQIKKIEGEMPFAGLGVKYVASGEEIYFVNNKKFAVKKGEYIIGNDFTSSIVKIDNREIVQGLCIDISAQIISEVAEYHSLSASDLKEFLLSDQLFVNRYNAQKTYLGHTLMDVNQKIISGQLNDNWRQTEFFYSLAESIINDQRFIFNYLHKLNFKKVITNEEVLRALLFAKEFIDEYLLEDLSLEQISRQVGISKYHFIRLFKNTFGISPYQYVKKKRLERAKQELLSGKPIVDVALFFGFADVPSFAKAFKQTFGCPPGKILK